jgi:hypothetical protein
MAGKSAMSATVATDERTIVPTGDTTPPPEPGAFAAHAAAPNPTATQPGAA